MALLELPLLAVDDFVEVAGASRLVLINRDPAPDEVDVPIDSRIALEIVDLGQDGVDLSSARILVDGAVAFGNGAPTPGFSGPRSEVVQSADALRITLDRTAPFSSQATVEVTVDVATNGGAQQLHATYSFVIEDRTAPRLLAALATAPRAVRVVFDEPVIVSNPLGLLFVAMDVPAVPVQPVAATPSGSVLNVFLDAEMTPDVHYRVIARSVTDANGNGVIAPFDGAVFVGFRPPRPRERRFNLWTMLPKHNRRSDTTGDLKKFIDCLQEVVDLLLADVDRFPDFFDIERAPEAFLDEILKDLGNPFPFELDALGKRRLATILVQMYQQKGTAIGIRNAVRFFMGIDIQSITPFTGTTLILGESELGVDWELGPSDRFSRYAFDVTVGVVLTDTQRKQLRAIVNYLRPGHTHFIDLIEPREPVTFDHWELGVSLLGVESILH